MIASSCSAAYIKTGREYVYTYTSSVTAGSEDYLSFASSFNITGKARIQKTSDTLIKVKLDDIKFGAYNGQWNYFPQPEYESKAFQELNPLTEPFQVQLDSNNLVSYKLRLLFRKNLSNYQNMCYFSDHRNCCESKCSRMGQKHPKRFSWYSSSLCQTRRRNQLRNCWGKLRLRQTFHFIS